MSGAQFLRPSRPTTWPSQKEAMRKANMLAVELGLPDGALPPHTDLAPKNIILLRNDILSALWMEPRRMAPILLAFSAHWLAALVTAIQSLDAATQPRALAVYIQVLALLPPPHANIHFRRALQSPLAAGLAPRVAARVVQDMLWLRPSGPGHVCALLAQLLAWGDPAAGDDGRAAIDAALRHALAGALPGLRAQTGTDRPQDMHRVGVDGLAALLQRIDGERMSVRKLRRRLERATPGVVSCFVCAKPTIMMCSGCGSIRFCSERCQIRAWDDGHVFECAPPKLSHPVLIC